jgi:hypothetical protein
MGLRLVGLVEVGLPFFKVVCISLVVAIVHYLLGAQVLGLTYSAILVKVPIFVTILALKGELFIVHLLQVSPIIQSKLDRLGEAFFKVNFDTNVCTSLDAIFRFCSVYVFFE